MGLTKRPRGHTVEKKKVKNLCLIEVYMSPSFFLKLMFDFGY